MKFQVVFASGKMPAAANPLGQQHREEAASIFSSSMETIIGIEMLRVTERSAENCFAPEEAEENQEMV